MRRTARLILVAPGVLAAFALVSATSPAAVEPVAVAQASRSGRGSSAPAGTGVIAGHVVEATTDTPLSGVVIQIATVLRRGVRPAGVVSDRVLVDRDGAWVFTKLPAGSYRIRAERPGYTDDVLGGRQPAGTMQEIELSDGEIRTDVAIGLRPVPGVAVAPRSDDGGGAISGTVRDPEGRPMPGVRVTAVTARAVVRATPPAADGFGPPILESTVTDSLGRYHLSVSPGEFIVDASFSVALSSENEVRAMRPNEVQTTVQQARTGSPAARDANARVDRAWTVTYARVFYPHTTDRQAATPVAVAAGQERRSLDLQVQLVTTRHIEGRVTLPGGRPAASVRVVATPAGTPESSRFETSARVARTDAEGHYTITGVIAGAYDVSALNPTSSPSLGQLAMWTLPTGLPSNADPPLWAAGSALVSDRDVTVPLALRLGVSVSGRVLFDGADPDVLEIARQRILIRNVAFPIAPPAIMIEPTARFELIGVIPGQYKVSYAGATKGPTWTLKSATAAGVNLLGAPMEVKAGQNMRDLVVVLTDRRR